MGHLTAQQRTPISTWRCARSTRRLWSLLIVVALCTSVWLVVAPPTDAVNPSRVDFLVPAGLCLVVALAAYRGGVYPQVIATSWGLILRNPLIPRQVSWGEIVQVIPGKDGITFIRAEKWPATAWAVQQAPISRLFRRITRAEIVVSHILDLAHEHGSPLDEDENLSYRAGPPS